MANPTQYVADQDILTTNDDGVRPGPPRALCIHTQEGDSTADGLARYQLYRSAGGSYHVIIDKTGRMVRSNDDAYIPWSAGWTGNRVALHVCLTGYASWSRQQWLDRPAQLDRLADWLRYNSHAYGIPLARITVEQLRGTGRGVCGHADISAAWKESTHWDPGPDFPYDEVLRRAGGGEAPRPADPPSRYVVQSGDTLSAIARKFGTTVSALANINRIKDPNWMRTGTVLKVRLP